MLPTSSQYLRSSKNSFFFLICTQFTVKLINTLFLRIQINNTPCSFLLRLSLSLSFTFSLSLPLYFPLYFPLSFTLSLSLSPILSPFFYVCASFHPHYVSQHLQNPHSLSSLSINLSFQLFSSFLKLFFPLPHIIIFICHIYPIIYPIHPLYPSYHK